MVADRSIVARDCCSDLGKTGGGLKVSYSRRDGYKYELNSFLASRIDKPHWLTKCKGLEEVGGVRDNTEVSALENSVWIMTYSLKLNTEGWGMGHGSVWTTMSVM